MLKMEPTRTAGSPRARGKPSERQQAPRVPAGSKLDLELQRCLTAKQSQAGGESPEQAEDDLPAWEPVEQPLSIAPAQHPPVPGVNHKLRGPQSRAIKVAGGQRNGYTSRSSSTLVCVTWLAGCTRGKTAKMLQM